MNALHPVVVIGAGLAGLTCARALHQRGRPVVVLERESHVGGRVRSFTTQGCTIDRGFQVCFTAYPTLAATLDFAALAPRRFVPGARLADGTAHPPLIGDGIRDRSLLAPTIASGAIAVLDKVRLLALRQFARGLSFDDCFQPEFASVTTGEFLRARGIGELTIQRFFAPFYGGILLDRSLSTRASVLLYTFKMLASGDTIVPARGMGAIPAQLAAALPGGSIRTGVVVRAIGPHDGTPHVILDDGSTLMASAVVVATEAPAARALALSAGVTADEPLSALGCTTLWYRAGTAPLPGTAIWLNPRADATVSHAVTITEVAPEYAPSGVHLLAATVLDPAAREDDDTLDARVRADLQWMRGTPLPPLERLAITRVPHAQYAQPVGQDVPDSAWMGAPWLIRASETRHSGSLEGAMRGGLLAARAIAGD